MVVLGGWAFLHERGTPLEIVFSAHTPFPNNPQALTESKLSLCRSGGNPGANLKPISHRCYLFEVAFVWELTRETIVLPLGCLQGGGSGISSAPTIGLCKASQWAIWWIRIGVPRS